MKSINQIFCILSLLFLLFVHTVSAGDSIVWMVDNLDNIGGFPLTVVGNPKVIEDETGFAVEFDGIDDGLFLNTNPVAGAEAFTVEIIFKPYAGGATEQRFLHIQQDDNNRMLIELRSTTTDQWYIDTFIKSGDSNKTLAEPSNLHPNGQWHTAALVYENQNMNHYIDGELEMTGVVNYVKQTSGITSLGVRQNKVAWYKGAIKMVRVTPRPLSPDEMLHVDKTNTAVSEFQESSIHGLTLKPICFSNDSKIGNLQIEAQNSGALAIDIFSLNGQKISLLQNRQINSGVHQIPFNFTNLPNGIYLLKANMNGYIQTQKFLIGK